MGTSGPAILQDDVAQDVRDSWIEAYRQTRTPAEATSRTLSSFKEELADSDDGPIVWISLALIQHSYGCLRARIRDRAIQVIDGRLGLERWREAGKGPLGKRLADYERAKKALEAP